MVLSEIFGEKCFRLKILEAFIDHIDEELSILDIYWLTDISEFKIYDYISDLLDKEIILKGDNIENVQFYYLNNEKQEVQILASIINNIITDKLSKKLEERGLEPIDNDD